MRWYIQGDREIGRVRIQLGFWFLMIKELKDLNKKIKEREK